MGLALMSLSVLFVVRSMRATLLSQVQFGVLEPLLAISLIFLDEPFGEGIWGVTGPGRAPF